METVNIDREMATGNLFVISFSVQNVWNHASSWLVIFDSVRQTGLEQLKFVVSVPVLIAKIVVTYVNESPQAFISSSSY